MKELPKISKEELLEAITDGVRDALAISSMSIEESVHQGVLHAFPISKEDILSAISDGTYKALKEEK